MTTILKQLLIFSAAILLISHASAMSSQEYIQKYKDCAIEQMLVYNIPASVTLAQGMLESDFGNSPLAKYANNHFGIKCHEDWNGAYYAYDDDEKGEHFRKYPSVDDSYRDHAQFLRSRPWYSFLFHFPRTDYRDWAMGLSKAGYATARNYSQRLISIIQENRLFVYDTILQNLQGFGILYDVAPAVPVVTQTLPDYVVLKQGDGIYKVAREYNIDVNTLCHINGISVNSKLAPGQKLYLKTQHKQSSMLNTKPKDKTPSTIHTGVSAILARRIEISESAT
ncbi:MAG TPA: glucosaminidase domain-containing protein [Bacteroidia bacterium]|nr:glucosaminidase domain-containing protein [Bacteroidia bacterium]